MYQHDAATGLLLPRRLRSQQAFQDAGWVQAASGIVLPVASLPAQRAKPTCVSLFTGAGGFDLGFHSAGFRIVAASDYEPVCAHTYGYNLGTRPMQFHFITEQDRERFIKKVVKPSHGKVTLDDKDQVYFHRDDRGPIAVEDGTPHFFLGDARKLTGRQILDAAGMQVGEVDAVCGGPPCQGFSVAGRREVMDPRNSLVFEFARLVLEIWPKCMIFENVPGIVSMVTPEGIPVLDAFAHILANGKYADYEALKQSLEYNLHSWGVVRDQGKSKQQIKKNSREQHHREEEKEEAGLVMSSLFEGEEG